MGEWSEPGWAYLGFDYLQAKGPQGSFVQFYIRRHPLELELSLPAHLRQAVPVAVVASMISMAAERLVHDLEDRHGPEAALLPVEREALRAELAVEREARLSLLKVMTWNPTEIIAERNRAQRESIGLRAALTAARKHLHGIWTGEDDPVERGILQELIDLADAALGPERTTTAEDGAGSEKASRNDESAPSEPPAAGSEFP